MHSLAVLALAPSFTKGVLVTVCAIVLFVGSPYLLVGAVFGLRLGYLVMATAFFAWMIILSALWSFGAPGTPRNLGPRGTEGHWQVIAATTQTTTTRFAETASFPERPWHAAPPGSSASSAVPTVTTAFQNYLAVQADHELARGGKEEKLDPTTFVIQNVRFATAKDGTFLAAGQAFFTSGGPEVTIFAYHDSGNVQIWSFAFLIVSILGFAAHVPFLDRAEKSRKEILTGGTAPAWYGPA